MDEVLGSEKKDLSKITSGSYDVNLFLEGGYEPGVISLFYGPAASGKSNFVTVAACSNAKKRRKIIFVDTEGSFSVDRVRQIAGNSCDEVLENVVIYKPTNFEEQKNAFMKIYKEYKSDNVGMIVVDSITMLYRLELADARKESKEKVQQVNSDLAAQMKALYEIAIKKDIPVLVTSQVYSDFLSEDDWLSGKEAGINVVGGDLLKYWSKCIIELQNKYGRKKAVLIKHRSLPNKELNFEICNEGIRKKTFLGL